MRSVAFLVLAAAQAPVPRGGYDGFWIGGAGPSAVHLELFGDLLRPMLTLTQSYSVGQISAQFLIFI